MSKTKGAKYKSGGGKAISLSQVSDAAEKFLEEAERCSSVDPEGQKPVMGFAAMTTAFACILAIGEALVGHNNVRDFRCIEEFCKFMNNNEWLLHKPDQPLTLQPNEILYEIRNALAHALSLPKTVALVPTKEICYSKYCATYQIGIVPSLFVNAVREATHEIIRNHPTKGFDLSVVAGKRRLLIERSPVKVDPMISGGSVPSVRQHL